MPRLAFKLSRVCIPAMVALAIAPGVAMADAPHDIAGSQRLWLDGLDVNGTDIGNGGGTNPTGGAQVTAWKDKSGNGYVAGNAASYGSNTHSYPTYTADGAVSFDGISNILEIGSGIYPNGSSVSNSEYFIVASSQTNTYQSLFWSGPQANVANRIAAHLPWIDQTIYWDHGAITSPGRLTASWSGNSSVFGRKYLYNLGASTTGGQYIVRDGISLASTTVSGTYTKASTDLFFLGGLYAPTGYFHKGTVSEFIVYNRKLNTAEKNIIHSYLAAKHANPGGAGTANKYTVVGSYRYHVGGIGQESDGSLATGTSAGLTIVNGTMLASGNYLLAGLDSLNPATGSSTTDAPTGYGKRSQRVWSLTRTGTNVGTVTMAFNLGAMGVVPNAGEKMALLYRTGTTGAFSTLATTTYGGAGTVSFTASSPQSGYYAIAFGTPVLGAVMSSTIVSDGVNTSNFKAIPGALVKEMVTVTNSGTGTPDANSTVLSFPVPTNVKLYVGDLGAAGSGPMLFEQGATASGLSYVWTSLASTTDGLDFSNDSGATWTYAPAPDAQQTDSAITNVRVKTTGTFASGTSPNFPSFALSYGLMVK